MKGCIICIFSSLLSLLLAAQPTYLNTKTTYQPQQLKHTQPPTGYQPFFINYVGRHGARFLTSKGNDAFIIDVLQQADNKDELTVKGKKILQQLQCFEEVETNNYGNITKLGSEEQQGIAGRLQKEYPSVFNKGTLLIEATDKVRTQQSAKAFLSGFRRYDSSRITTLIFPADADSVLRFYDLSADYKKYAKSNAVQLHLDSLLNDERTLATANNVCNQLFKPSFINQLATGTISSIKKNKKETLQQQDISTALYDIYCILFSAQTEMQVQYKPFVNELQAAFSVEDLSWLDQVTCASDFYEKGPGENANGIQITIAAPLLRDLVVTTQKNIENKKQDAIFRFTHAEAISPLATLMGIPQACQTASSVYHFSDGWKAAQIIPLSANIQWILYSNGSNYLIKILLNEKEVALPIPTKKYPYYNWLDVQQFYLQKLNGLSYSNSN